MINLFKKRKFHNQFHYATAGNALIEYVVIGLTTIMVCSSGLMFIGQNINQLLTDFLAEMQAHKQNSITVAAALKSQVEAAATNTPASPSTTIPPTLSLNEIEQNLLQSTLAEKLQTTGANGSTELLARQLELTA